jgi:hypothetical protein
VSQHSGLIDNDQSVARVLHSLKDVRPGHVEEVFLSLLQDLVEACTNPE